MTLKRPASTSARDGAKTFLQGLAIGAVVLGGWPCLAAPNDGPPLTPATAGSPGTPPATAKGVNPDDIPAVIDPGAAAAPAIVAKLRSGEISPEEAWKAGQLSEQDILNILGADEGGASGEAGTLAGDLDPALAGVLVEHYPDLVKDPSNLKPAVRLWIGEYYRLHQDARAAPVLQALIIEGAPRTSSNGTRLPAAYYYEHATRSLGEYYAAAGDYRKAIDAFLQVLPNSTNAGYCANATLAAARMYTRMGDLKKAHELYHQVEQYGDDWTTGLANADQAVEMMAQHRLNDAELILKRPARGPVRVAISALLGDCCYRSGDFRDAVKYCSEALALVKFLPPAPSDSGMDQALNSAQRCLEDSQLWAAGPFTCDSTPLTVVLERSGRPVIRRIEVRAFQPVKLVASTRNTALHTRIDTQWSIGARSAATKIVLEVDPTTIRTTVDDVITVRSLQLPTFQIVIPVRVEVVPSILASPSSVFLGFVKVGVQASGTLTLSSRQPFRVLKLEPDSSDFKVGADAGGRPAVEHLVSYTFTAKPGPTWIQGLIKVVTDSNEQQEVDIPYFASLK